MGFNFKVSASFFGVKCMIISNPFKNGSSSTGATTSPRLTGTFFTAPFLPRVSSFFGGMFNTLLEKVKEMVMSSYLDETLGRNNFWITNEKVYSSTIGNVSMIKELYGSVSISLADEFLTLINNLNRNELIKKLFHKLDDKLQKL